MDPEVDVLEDAAGDGHHMNTAELINIGLSRPRGFTIYGELWGDWNFEPSGLVRQSSADAAVSYVVTLRLQLDIGVNFGLDHSTPAAQGYVGVSQLF